MQASKFPGSGAVAGAAVAGAAHSEALMSVQGHLAGGQRMSDGPQRMGSSFGRMSPLDESHPHSPQPPEAVGAAAAAPSRITGSVGRPSHVRC